MAETFLQIGEAAILVPIFTQEIKASQEEHNALKSTLAPALRASQIDDMPPWLAFACVSIGVYAPKFTKPTVRERAIMLWLRITRRKPKELKPVDEIKNEHRQEPKKEVTKPEYR